MCRRLASYTGLVFFLAAFVGQVRTRFQNFIIAFFPFVVVERHVLLVFELGAFCDDLGTFWGSMCVDRNERGRFSCLALGEELKGTLCIDWDSRRVENRTATAFVDQESLFTHML